MFRGKALLKFQGLPWWSAEASLAGIVKGRALTRGAGVRLLLGSRVSAWWVEGNASSG